MHNYKSFLIIFFAALFFSCSSKDLVKNEYSALPKAEYLIIYIINGDGDYLYHDLNGNPHLADEDKLSEAVSVAESCRKGEVFIFHQKQRSGFLFFHSDDGEYYYYRNGKLVDKDTYSRAESSHILESELNLYRSYKSNDSSKKIFLYFGHEIPEIGGDGYFASYPDRKFNINSFSGAVSLFASGTKFNLIVLSTCHNGTPGVISKLSPFSDFIIASPEDLHLSYMDTKYLEKLDSVNNIEFQFAKEFAEKAFHSLEEKTQTVVSITLYDTHKVSGYLNKIKASYTSLLISEDEKSYTELEYIDLKEVPDFYSRESGYGVTAFYRPPRFGINKNKNSHSGWELLKIK